MTMKRKILLTACALVVVILLAIAAVFFGTSVKLSSTESGLTVSEVLYGSEEISLELDEDDISALSALLAVQESTGGVSFFTRIELTDGTIQINGRDDDGTTHYVLTSRKCIFYRSSTRYLTLENSSELYQAVSAYLAEE